MESQQICCPRCGNVAAAEDDHIAPWINCVSCGFGFAALSDDCGEDDPPPRKCFLSYPVMLLVLIWGFGASYLLGMLAKMVVVSIRP